MTPAKMFDGDLWMLASDATQMAESAYKKGQADEREACAKLCETEMRDWYASQDKSAQSKIMLYAAVYDCAAAIRARERE
jgi:hypothetical protein